MEKVNVLACECDIRLNFLALLLTRYCFSMCLVVKATLKSQIIFTENIYHTKSIPLYVSQKINELLSFESLIVYSPYYCFLPFAATFT